MRAAGPTPTSAWRSAASSPPASLYAVIGLVVMEVGYAWIERLMPPRGDRRRRRGDRPQPRADRGQEHVRQHVRHVDRHRDDRRRRPGRRARARARAAPADPAGRRRRLLLYAVLANGLGLGKPIDFAARRRARRGSACRRSSRPVWSAQAIALIAPVAIVLVAENLGHVKAVAAMTGENLDPYLGRAFLGDGIATMVAGAGGGTGVTTYAENIGVMAVTKIYSTLVFVVAAVTAIVLGFSPKFGALIMTIPGRCWAASRSSCSASSRRPARASGSQNQRGLLARAQSRHGRRHADDRRRRPRAQVRRLHARRHRHRDVRRDPPLPTAGATTARNRRHDPRPLRVAVV